MADLTREEVDQKIKNGESLQGWDLSGLDLGRLDIAGAKFYDVNLDCVLAIAATHDVSLFTLSFKLPILRSSINTPSFYIAAPFFFAGGISVFSPLSVAAVCLKGLLKMFF